MTVHGYRLTLLLGVTGLALFLPACATPLRPSSAPDAPPPAALTVAAEQVNETKLAEQDSSPLPWPGLQDDQDAQTEQPAGFWKELCCDLDWSMKDYRGFYQWRNLAWVALGLGLAAPLANTTADEDARRWYQQRIKRDELDPVSSTVNIAMQVWVVAPACMELMGLAGMAPEDYRSGGGFWEWGHRSSRAIALGYPPVVALYGLLGASRPDHNNSRWRPFHDFHGVSGHTFLGAVPWLTAAAMTDNPWLKYPLMLGSMLMGWSRYHEDKHYLTQICLGWWLAYLTVKTVDRTQEEWQALTIYPFTTEGPGVTVEIRY
jgi:hypothetical protein